MHFNIFQALNETKKKVFDLLQNDFNTGAVISEISHLIGVANKMLHETEVCIYLYSYFLLKLKTNDSN